MKHRILLDLKVAMNNGFCGIGTENRLIFNMLSGQEQADISGLLVSDHSTTTLTKFKKASGTQGIQQANRFFHEALDHELFFKNSILMKLRMHYFQAFRRKPFDLFDIDAVFNDVIWRNVFDKTLPVNVKDAVLDRRFYYSNLVQLHLNTASYFNYHLPLKTEGYDFALFMEPLPIKVSPQTTKIVRFHDAIPLSDPDFSNTRYAHGKMNVLNQCAKDSYFVCNSAPTRDVLLAIKPELENRSSVIPCVIVANEAKVKNFALLKQIMSTRLSQQLTTDAQLVTIRERLHAMTDCDYFFHLATLDPKKNQVTLIKAWEKVHYHSGGKIKLILAANKGWLSGEVEALMRPHIQLGNIIHLSNLSNEDVPYLYSHARAFVFPSYIEGFGLPPLEAMQCECPVIVSDIKTHRWVYGDAALYSNPYDVDALAQQMECLINDEGQVLRQNLINKGLQQIKKYTQTVLGEQWMNLFDTLKK
ncbi:MAG: glycosyltransferase family 1 protein [Gammaproteobacteria bacterium]